MGTETGGAIPPKGYFFIVAQGVFVMVVMHPLQNQKLSGIIRQTFEELCLYETIRGRLEIKSYSVTSEYKKLRKVFVVL